MGGRKSHCQRNRVAKSCCGCCKTRDAVCERCTERAERQRMKSNCVDDNTKSKLSLFTHGKRHNTPPPPPKSVNFGNQFVTNLFKSRNKASLTRTMLKQLLLLSPQKTAEFLHLLQLMCLDSQKKTKRRGPHFHSR